MATQTDTIQVTGIRCERCVMRLAKTLEGHEGLEFANANLMGQVMLEWDDEQTTRDALVAALDRRSFLQFLGLTDSSTIPDAKTIWLFRDRLAQAGLGTQLFEQVQQQLLAQGYQARCGQIVDASLVQAPVQRNKREEAEIVKQSIMPTTWTAHKRAQKDVDAKWTKKHGKNHFGYKLHASVDKRYKVIRKVIITHAAVADTTVFEDLLDTSNTSR
ncbi:MAG TPA: transposase, partial [Gaiellaceae bacterium]